MSGANDTRALWLGLLAGTVLTSCGTGSSGDKATEPGDDIPIEKIDEESIPDASLGDGVTVPGPATPPSHRRQRKRMTVPQVRDSMQVIAGGVVWGDDERSDWDRYAATLGVADFQTRTTTDRTPSVLFQKFLDDAAVHTCAGWSAATSGDFDTLDDPESTDLDAVRTGVTGLRWRIHGRSRTTSDPMIDDATDLFATVYRRTDSTDLAWQTVCVALFTHPDFFMY